MQIVFAVKRDRAEILSLLTESGLPVEDLPLIMDSFLIAVEGDRLIGVVGIEQYGRFGLLRSLAVDKEFRGNGIASFLVRELELLASRAEIDALFLLTKTAERFFGRRGYEKVSRDQVPEDVRASSEFSHVCPVTAVAMRKAVIRHVIDSA